MLSQNFRIRAVVGSCICVQKRYECMLRAKLRIYYICQQCRFAYRSTSVCDTQDTRWFRQWYTKFNDCAFIYLRRTSSFSPVEVIFSTTASTHSLPSIFTLTFFPRKISGSIDPWRSISNYNFAYITPLKYLHIFPGGNVPRGVKNSKKTWFTLHVLSFQPNNFVTRSYVCCKPETLTNMELNGP